MDTIRETIEIDAPVREAYNQWTQFETWPHFMDQVQDIEQLTDTELRWHTSIAGKDETFRARITEQVPDELIAWTTLRGDIEHRGRVIFEEIESGRTRVSVELEHDPQGALEKLGSVLGLDDHAVSKDLENFRSYIEDRGTATGAWRGEIRNGSVTTLDADNPRSFDHRSLGATGGTGTTT